MNQLFRWLGALVILGVLAGCASQEKPAPAPAPPPRPISSAPPASSAQPAHPDSRWIPVRWDDLPGFERDDVHAAWNAWLRSCSSPGTALAHLCDDVRRLSIAGPDAQRAWMRANFQPYRVEAPGGGETPGLLTSYFEPVYEATRVPQGAFQSPLFSPPPGVSRTGTWYTRRQIDTQPDIRALLSGAEIAWLADPVDAMILQIQGSGRLRITEPDGRVHVERLAFAGTNNQPYRSPGKWLLAQGAISDATWPGIKAWLAANPERVQEFLWSNPRVVFFREEPIEEEGGPRGAQGVPLTAGRSIAVDPQSIPYGTPVWLASSGPVAHLERLVLAQDTGHAIRGAVRADYFAGTGAEAEALAGRLSQGLRLWVLWPR